MKTKLTFILFSFMIMSCASKKNIASDMTYIEENPKLIFLNYTIFKDANNNKHIEFINKIIADGKLKHGGTKYLKLGTTGDLKCTQLDKHSNAVNTIFIQNPLIQDFESLSDSLTFEYKTLQLKQAPLTLKLQLHSNATSIEIYEVIDSLQNTRPLIKTKLN